MEIKKFFKTNSSLGYSQFAYFIKVGAKYFCIGSNNIIAEEEYPTGSINLFEDYEVEKIEDMKQKRLIWKEFKTNKIAYNLLSAIDALLAISENNGKQDEYGLQCTASSVLVDFEII